MDIIMNNTIFYYVLSIYLLNLRLERDLHLIWWFNKITLSLRIKMNEVEMRVLFELSLNNHVCTLMYRDYVRYSRRVTNFSEWLTLEF